jgi:hypothetical protein
VRGGTLLLPHLPAGGLQAAPACVQAASSKGQQQEGTTGSCAKLLKRHLLAYSC